MMSNPKNINQLFVFKDTEYVGTLERTERGCIFSYDQEFIQTHSEGISYSLPLHQNSYHQEGFNLLPFFANLLPEGLRLKALIRSVKTSEDDLFSLLAASPEDTIGDVSLKHSLGEDPSLPSTIALNKPLDSISFQELFLEVLTTNRNNSDTSIAGIQNKLSSELLSLPVTVANKKKRYILKLSTPNFPCLVENEFFFMNLAREYGLSVPDTSIVHDRNKESALLVERFDRTYDKKSGRLKKIYQEDACQLLTLYPADKYRVRSIEIAKAIENFCTAPILENTILLKQFIFSYLIGNGDMHAKNISICKTTDGRISISPAYDLLSTFPYSDFEMALEFEGRNKKIYGEHFISFGKRLGIKEIITKKLLKEFYEKSSDLPEQVTTIGFSEKKTTQLQSLIGERRDFLIKRIE
jgi:serine/threonine-protein kinase HipA